MFIFACYFVLLLADLINNIVIVAIADKNNLEFMYNEFIIFKMLIRRISMLLMFKVLFTLNRVQIQLDPSNTTE